MIKQLKIFLSLSITILMMFTESNAQQNDGPKMGWSSWNSFRVNINERLIKEQADALVSKGLKEAGYNFINIDDGYFGGRDSDGKLFADSIKFPAGMDKLADYVHSKGLKIGLYSDAGANTCGSIWDNDLKGVGVGMFGHELQDARLFFINWKYDFIKIDYCGGLAQKLDERTQYMKIINAVKACNANVGINICRWQFPGSWAVKAVGSWRIAQDITNNFNSVLSIIDVNRPLYKYASKGHYNDMDMLQVGRGMTYEEDKTHFSMWCILNSPLMAGNDLRSISSQTLEILTNTELIALNQDKAYKQARRISVANSVEVWRKVLKNKKTTAIAIMNRRDTAVNYRLDAVKLGLNPGHTVRDLWQHRSLGKLNRLRNFTIAPHGIIVLLISA